MKTQSREMTWNEFQAFAACIKRKPAPIDLDNWILAEYVLDTADNLKFLHLISPMSIIQRRAFAFRHYKNVRSNEKE